MGGRIDREARNAYCREYRKRRRAADPAYVEKLRDGANTWAKKNRATEHGKSLRRAQLLRHRYGMTAADYERMLEEQRYVCAACGSFTELVIDHDHKTDEVRGLLCHACNVALGLMRDDPERLERAAAYLRRHQWS